MTPLCPQPDEYDVLQQEGARVAQHAVEQLQRSQSLVQDAPITSPTWTGRRGEAGVAPRFGQTVAALRAGDFKARVCFAHTRGSAVTLVHRTPVWAARS